MADGLLDATLAASIATEHFRFLSPRLALATQPQRRPADHNSAMEIFKTSYPVSPCETPTANLIRLPTELIILISDTITDPLDLHALRVTNPRLYIILTPRFTRLYNPDYLFNATYRQLPIMCRSCEQNPTLRILPTHTDGLHGPQLAYDALLFHAGTHNHLRHAYSILRQPYPPPLPAIAGNIHCINWDGWQQALSACARNGYTHMLALLLHHPPPTFFQGLRMRAIPVHWAVLSGDMRGLELLLQARMPLDDYDTIGATPLFLAVRAHRVDMVALLLRAGATAYSLDTRANGQRAEPLLAAASGSGGKKGWCQRMIWELMFRGAKMWDSVSARQVRVGPDVADVAGTVEGGCYVLMQGLGIEEGDEALHLVARVERRDCGVECEVWKGQKRRITEEEVWEDLVEHGSDPMWINAHGYCATELWAAKMKRLRKERLERGVEEDGDVIMTGM